MRNKHLNRIVCRKTNQEVILCDIAQSWKYWLSRYWKSNDEL